MHVRSDSMVPYQYMNDRLALCKPHDGDHVTFSDNRNPHLQWSGAPSGTRSFAIVCVDPEVPTEGTHVNKEGVTVPVDLPRCDFFHWVLIDLPATLQEIAEGAHSNEVTPRGKAFGPSPDGGRQGVNSYTGWFDGHPDMGGQYCGYDGPCPPWNDERIHCYEFTVYALDVDKLDVDGEFDGPAALAAMEGHILDSATIRGLFTFQR